MSESPCGSNSDLTDEECRVIKRIETIAKYVEEIQRLLDSLNTDIIQSDWYFLTHSGQVRSDAKMGERRESYVFDLDKDSEQYLNDIRGIYSLIARARSIHVVREVKFIDGDDSTSSLH